MMDRKKLGFTSGRFALELDGHDTGVIHSIDGGHLKAEPITAVIGGEGGSTRYPGRQKIEDITIQIGASMSGSFWSWIKASIGNKPERRNGAIVAYDFDGKERSRRTFADALISEFQLPALDLRSKDAKLVTVKFAPETIKWKEGGGAKGGAAVDMKKQKRFLPSSFSFRLDKIPADTSRWVSKIEALTIKQNVITTPVGGMLYARKEPGRIEFPSVSITIPEAFAKPYIDWWHRFVDEGKHSSEDETTGAITYLSTDNKELLSIALTGVGINNVTFDKLQAGAEQARNVKIDLYVESMDLKAPSA